MKKLLVLLILPILLSSCGNNSKEIVPESIVTSPEQESNNVADETVIENVVEDLELKTVFQTEHPYYEQYEIWDISTEVFNEETLAIIGANGFSGSDEEISQQIYDWQTANMEFAGADDSYTDAGYGARWNAIIPGIYPASKRINHLTDDGKIYGICFDFAYIYCAIANSYNLDCRVATYTYETYEENNGVHPWLLDESTFRGLGRDEYELLKVELDAEDIDLTYDQIHRAIQGYSLIDGQVQGPHGRAEVLINDEWLAFDATIFFNGVPSNVDLIPENYSEQNWDGIYNPIRLYAPEFQDSSVERAKINFDALGTYLSFGPQVQYLMAITDDYGNENRAHDFDAFVRGDAYLPYVDSEAKLQEFLLLPDDALEGEGYDDILAEFYENTGRPFNIIADFLIFEDDNMNAEDYISKYNGITNDNLTVEEFNDFIK
jgi:hypothetical protein